jgi:hypothetical protein
MEYNGMERSGMKYNNNVSNACKASIKANDSPIT